MLKQLEIEIHGEKLILFPDRSMYLPSANAIIISDTHFGKVTHFRKAGIGLPIAASHVDFKNLHHCLKRHEGADIIFLGDLFHSEYNSAVSDFHELRKEYGNRKFILVRGNHDILPSEVYDTLNITLSDNLCILDKFMLVHEPVDVIDETYYTLSGHIHAGVRLIGRGKQSMTLPCFHFGTHQGILPAFGYFTGYVRLKVGKEDRVVAIADDLLIHL